MKQFESDIHTYNKHLSSQEVSSLYQKEEQNNCKLYIFWYNLYKEAAIGASECKSWIIYLW